MGVIIDTINLIFTIPQEQSLKLKSSIENVLNQTSVIPKHLVKRAGQPSSMHLALGLIVRLFLRKIYYDIESRFSWQEVKV